MTDTTTPRPPAKHVQNERRLLVWLAARPDRSTRATNQRLAAELDLPLDTNRLQSRRLSETLAALRNQGLIDIVREHPHPLESPAGRVIVLTDAGLAVALKDAA